MLLDESMERCVFLNKSIEDDGYGGYIEEWRQGAEFDAAIVLNTSIEARLAEKQGVTAIYTVTTSKMLNLQYHDVFQRLEDGKIFRVKSDGDDNKTPESATLDMRQVTAEEFELGGSYDG